jgi:hypothetical protein
MALPLHIERNVVPSRDLKIHTTRYNNGILQSKHGSQGKTTMMRWILIYNDWYYQNDFIRPKCPIQNGKMDQPSRGAILLVTYGNQNKICWNHEQLGINIPTDLKLFFALSIESSVHINLLVGHVKSIFRKLYWVPR